MEGRKMFVPHELKTIEIDVEKKKKKKASKAVRTPKKPGWVDVLIGEQVIFRLEIRG